MSVKMAGLMWIWLLRWGGGFFGLAGFGSYLEGYLIYGSIGQTVFV